MYRAALPITIDTRTYAAGDEITGVAEKRLAYLVARGFVERVPDRPDRTPLAPREETPIETADAPPADRPGTETADAPPKRRKKAAPPSPSP